MKQIHLNLSLIIFVFYSQIWNELRIDFCYVLTNISMSCLFRRVITGLISISSRCKMSTSINWNARVLFHVKSISLILKMHFFIMHYNILFICFKIIINDLEIFNQHADYEKFVCLLLCTYSWVRLFIEPVLLIIWLKIESYLFSGTSRYYEASLKARGRLQTIGVNTPFLSHRELLKSYARAWNIIVIEKSTNHQ